MNAHERKQSGLNFFLHLYTEKACVKESLFIFPGEIHRIYLPSESLQTAFSVELTIYRKEQELFLNGQPIYEENFCFMQTGAGEELMVVLSKREEALVPCGKIFLWDKTKVKVGNNFLNEVFYDCFSFIKDIHISIYREQENFFLVSRVNEEEEGKAVVYLNGTRASDRQKLNPGDRITLLGLMLIYLPGMLVCCSFYGTLRTAEGRKRFSYGESMATEALEDKAGEPKQAVISEKQLMTGDMELELPEPVKTENTQPLFLTLGPVTTMMIPMLLMAALGSAMSVAGGGYYTLSIVMMGASSILTGFWAVVSHLYKKKVSRKEMNSRIEGYEEYLKETEQYLQDTFRYNKEALLEKYPSCRDILWGNKGPIYFNRPVRQKGAFFLRLGIGALPFQIKVKISASGRQQKKDRLTRKAVALAEKYEMLTGVPVGIDLREHRIVGFCGELVCPVFLQAILQLAACYDGSEVKLVYFYHRGEEKERRIAECIKWLPHIWSSGKKLRYLAGDEKEAGEIVPELSKELINRQESRNSPFCTYVFLIAAPELFKGEGIYRLFMDAGENSEIYGLFSSREREGIIGECECFVIRDKSKGEITYYDREVFKRQTLTLEEAGFQETEGYMRRLSGQSFTKGEQKETLPGKVAFLDLYDCKRVEDLNSRLRWRENQTVERIKVPVGKAAGGRVVCLNIHEKFHGPHGLVAGTTGSGKSELLQTYLLSLAVSFGPEDINFFIIDYKGGGMGNVLQNLPHCAGVISNLSGSQIRRSLSSVKSENLRRQRLLQKAGVNHVEDYTRLFKEGKLPEPIPHLLLVIDEFAELKKEEPEFMQEIISVAQVGRSLGVHLILSTQKPAGTVDDKIWSNTRFRLCLRVADRQDSMDMLHRPEAASLTGAGQCYLQVGNDELYELFQAGYGGVNYEEKESPGKEVCLVSPTGKRVYAKKEEKEKGPTQMEAVIAYVNRVAEETGDVKARHLWMPELEEQLALSMLPEKAKAEDEIIVCLGMCDDPEQQKQYPLYYEPLKEGSLLLCGAPATGKSTFLQTVLFQLCSYPVNRVCFLIAGSDNAGVNCFDKMPGCIGSMQRKEEAECFFYHLNRLLANRKEELKGMNFLQYRRHKENAGPFYFLIIDNYGSFRQMTEDRYEELIEKIAGEGWNYGIYLLITSLNVGSGEVTGKLAEKLKVTFSLEMSDRFRYGDILRRYHIRVFPKENVKGRGLCVRDGRVLEFQTPLCSAENDDYERIREIITLGKKRSQENVEKPPKRFPVIPKDPVFSEMAAIYREGNNKGNRIPLGYVKESGCIAAIPIKDGFSFLISGAEQSGKRNLFCCMIKDLWDKGIPTAVFDRKNAVIGRVRKMAKETGFEKLLHVLDSEKEFISQYDSIEKLNRDKNAGGCFFCISDLADFSVMISQRDSEMLEIRQKLERQLEEKSLMPVIAVWKPGREMEASGTPLFSFLQEQQCGIHLGGNVTEQRVLSFDDLSYAQMNRWERPGIGYLKTQNGSKTEMLIVPLYEKEVRDDTFGYSGSGVEQYL